jgi:hypothetical protein
VELIFGSLLVEVILVDGCTRPGLTGRTLSIVIDTGVLRAGFLDALDAVFPVTQIRHVRHQIREARLADEVEPVALRRFVGRLGPAGIEGHLRIPHDRLAHRFGRGDDVRVAWIAKAAQIRVPAARGPVGAKARRHVARELLHPFV